jgi:septum site-determining protein MinC
MLSAITIKGTKEGLVFLFHETCPYETLLTALAEKVEQSSQLIQQGQAVHVQLKFGSRILAEEQLQQVKAIILATGHFQITAVQVVPTVKVIAANANRFSIDQGIVRSGQVYRCEGDLLFIGDINPGGQIEVTGNLYVIGSIKGVAAAGILGDERAVIVATYMRPTQLRIAQVISRTPDEWFEDDAGMMFAMVEQDVMTIRKIAVLAKHRPLQQAIHYFQAYPN